MRLAYPSGEHKNQLQEHISTIYGDCQMVGYKILYNEYKVRKHPVRLGAGLDAFGLDIWKCKGR